VYLCIKSNKSSLRIESCAKLAPWYCGPLKILERVGRVVCQPALHLTIKSMMFSMCHCLRSMLKMLIM